MKTKKRIFIILTLIWTAVIFAFSLQSGAVSGDLSGSIIEKVLAIFMPNILENPEQLEMAHYILRKCAHFTEFMMLGVLARNAMQNMEVHYKGISGFLYCVCIASVDETLQLFISGRAGRVQDVMIDSAGALTGTVLVYVWMKMIRKCNKH